MTADRPPLPRALVSTAALAAGLAAALVAAPASHLPAPVSPGAPARAVEISDACPTFSLTAGDSPVELAVYGLRDPDSLEPDAEPAIRQRLPAGAAAWSPASELCLRPGGVYAWAVRAVDAEEPAGWSAPLLFTVRSPAAPPLAPVDSSVDAARVVDRLPAHREGPGRRPPTRDPLLEPTQGPGTRQAAGLSVPAAPAAFRATQGATSGDSLGVVGVTASPGGAGVAAMNTDPAGGADLVLDGSAQGAGDTALDQSSMVVGGPSFDLGNATGDLVLTLDGVPVVTTATDQGTDFTAGNQLQLAAGVLDVLEGAGSGLDADTLDGFHAADFLTASTDDWVDVTGDTMTGDLVLAGAGTDLLLGGDLDLGGVVRRGSTRLLHAPGTGNTGLGLGALESVTTGQSNTAVGYQALASNVQTGSNTAVGSQALAASTTGYSNTAVGRSALRFSTSGRANVAVGLEALASNTTGDQNTALGSRALASSTTASGNTAVGFESLQSSSGGGANTALGTSALRDNTTGGGNTAVGFQTLRYNVDGPSNTAIGLQALYSNTTGGGNTAVGSSTLTANQTGDANTAIGFLALSAGTGSRNTAVGSGALSASTSGSSNTAVGEQALAANTGGGSNTAIGRSALAGNTTGSFNVALGRSSLTGNTIGLSNIAIGRYALNTNSSGSYNVAVGTLALAASKGSNNVAIGLRALDSVSTGTDNIGLGTDAGQAITTGSDNIMIGNDGLSSDTATVRIGAAQTRAFVAGIRGVTTASPDAITVMIDSKGQLGTKSSSRATKRDIEGLADDLGARLLALRPVSFRYRDHPPDAAIQYGLIAEEVAEIFPELVVYDEEGRPQTVRYHLLAPLLLGELQRQAAATAELAHRLRRLEQALGLAAARTD
ncbi:MAG TPA: tail fiber domain-containing protein [Thermoanaerobaculia bacterium]|nr:tail fiber domain-containing protein [Thermoanaerobaculia bacterium]